MSVIEVLFKKKKSKTHKCHFCISEREKSFKYSIKYNNFLIERDIKDQF